jgi:signal transduction histidine kinase
MVEDMWQHTLVQKASSIRNYAQMVRKWLERGQRMPGSAPSVDEIITEIDRLAEDIANAPPRVPHDSEMQSEHIPIAPLLQEIAERERQSMRLHDSPQHKIDVSMRGLGGVQVFGYRRWLIFIFECLFNNAYAAMPKGGGQISVFGRKQKGWVEIRIRDTGKGIPRRLQDKIFKVPITGRQNHKGLGIGSLLVKTLMEEHHGTIELERPGPCDTTVLIRFPISKQAKKV